MKVLQNDLDDFESLRDKSIPENDLQEEIVKDQLFVFDYVKLLIKANQKGLENTKEYKDCVESINNDRLISEQLKGKVIYVLSVVNRINPKSFLMHILIMLISNYIITKNIDNSLLATLYSDFENFFYDDTLTIVTLSPLKGFNSYDINTDSVSVSENISIRRLTLEEKILMYERGIPDEIVPIAAKWVLECKTSLKKNLSINPRIEEGLDCVQIDTVLASVITAMRLFQQGSVGIYSYTQYIPSNIPIYTPLVVGLQSMGLDTFRLGYYLFNDDSSIKFKEFWNSFGEKLIRILDFKEFKNDPYNNIKNALHRFNYACQRETGEDAIVDYVISLEALLSTSGDPDSINYKLSSRTAKLIENDWTERSAKIKEVKKIFGTKCSIVHGEPSIENYNLIAAYNIISESIKKYLILLDNHSHNQIINRLEYGC